MFSDVASYCYMLNIITRVSHQPAMVFLSTSEFNMKITCQCYSVSSTPTEVENIYDCVSDNTTYLFWLMNMDKYIYIHTIIPLYSVFVSRDSLMHCVCWNCYLLEQTKLIILRLRFVKTHHTTGTDLCG